MPGVRFNDMRPGAGFDRRRFVPTYLLAALGVLSAVGCSQDDGTFARSVQVEAVSRASEDSTGLDVLWTGGGCDIVDSIAASAAEDEGRVTITLRMDVSDAKECPAVAAGGVERIVLSKQLGTRELVDSSNGKSLSLVDARCLRPLRPRQGC